MQSLSLPKISSDALGEQSQSACQDPLQEFDHDLSSNDDTSNTNLRGCTMKQKACPRPVLQHGGYREALDSLFDDHLATDPTGDVFGNYQVTMMQQ
jgi:hypothetical protein